MSQAAGVLNRVKGLRLARGWSQAELARRAGISRAAVSAIEIERLIPSVAAALALAGAFGCRVDALFSLDGSKGAKPQWAWPAKNDPCRYWHAELAGRTLLYPVEATGLGVVGHDGICRHGVVEPFSRNLPEETLVMASCDPAAALLAAELARGDADLSAAGFATIKFQALHLVGEKLVHAGVHLARAGQKGGNAAAVRKQLGPGYSLLTVARWQEGLAVAPGLGISSVSGAQLAKKVAVGGARGGFRRPSVS